MKDSGKRTNNTEKALRLGLMELPIKETTSKDKSMELAASHGLMAAPTLEHSTRTT